MMNRLKKQVAFLLAVGLLFNLTACSRPAGDDTLYFPTNTSNQEISASMSSENVMKDVGELYERADNVVVASVVGCEPYSDGWISFVYSQADIEETLKGELHQGERITITETGEHLENGNDYSIDGVPLLYPGMKVILFLDSEGPLEDPERTGYGLIGGYAGKFIYHPDGSIYSFSLLGGKHVRTLSDAKEPMTEEQFRALLPQESTTAADTSVTE